MTRPLYDQCARIPCSRRSASLEVASLWLCSMSPPPSSGWRSSRPAENPVSPRIPHVITASGAACSPRTTPSQNQPKFEVLLLREGSASNRLPNLGTLAGEDALELLRGACHDTEVQVAQAIADVLIGEG